MHRLIWAVTLVMLTLCISGCSIASRMESYKKRMNAWVGKSSEELVKEWGPPISSYNLANGDKVFEYKKERAAPNIGANIWRGGNFFPAPLEQASIECVVRFTINQGGQIVNWSGDSESEICY